MEQKDLFAEDEDGAGVEPPAPSAMPGVPTGAITWGDVDTVRDRVKELVPLAEYINLVEYSYAWPPYPNYRFYFWRRWLERIKQRGQDQSGGEGGGDRGADGV